MLYVYFGLYANLNTYVSNNPTNFTDPTGHFGSGVFPVGPMPGGGGDPVESPGHDDGGWVAGPRCSCT